MMAHLYDTLEENQNKNSTIESSEKHKYLHNRYLDTVKEMLVMNGNALFTNVISKLMDEINKETDPNEQARKLNDMQTMLPMRFRVEGGVTAENVHEAIDKIMALSNEFNRKLSKHLNSYQQGLNLDSGNSMHGTPDFILDIDRSAAAATAAKGGKRKSHKRRQRHPSRKHTKREHRNRKNKTNKKRKSKRRSVRRTVRRR